MRVCVCVCSVVRWVFSHGQNIVNGIWTVISFEIFKISHNSKSVETICDYRLLPLLFILLSTAINQLNLLTQPQLCVQIIRARARLEAESEAGAEAEAEAKADQSSRAKGRPKDQHRHWALGIGQRHFHSWLWLSRRPSMRTAEKLVPQEAITASKCNTCTTWSGERE